jgi:transposase-like protein
MPKSYSPKLKFQVVMELLQGDKTPGQVAKAYGVHPNSASAWRRTFLEKGPEIFAKDSAVAEYERQIEKLEQLLGKKEVEIALSPALRAGACVKNFLGQAR